MTEGQLILHRWRALPAAQQEALSGKAISSLPPVWHEILLLVEGEGQSLEAVADRLKQSVSSVEDTLKQARDWMYRYLKIELMRCPDENGSGGGTPSAAATAALPQRFATEKKTIRSPIYDARKIKA